MQLWRRSKVVCGDWWMIACKAKTMKIVLYTEFRSYAWNVGFLNQVLCIPIVISHKVSVIEGDGMMEWTWGWMVLIELQCRIILCRERIATRVQCWPLPSLVLWLMGSTIGSHLDKSLKSAQFVNVIVALPVFNDVKRFESKSRFKDLPFFLCHRGMASITSAFPSTVNILANNA